LSHSHTAVNRSPLLYSTTKLWRNSGLDIKTFFSGTSELFEGASER